jgi:hypothetical protein
MAKMDFVSPKRSWTRAKGHRDVMRAETRERRINQLGHLCKTKLLGAWLLPERRSFQFLYTFVGGGGQYVKIIPLGTLTLTAVL